MKRIIFLAGLLFGGFVLFAQSTDLSLSELKEKYFEKRRSFSSSSTKKITADQQSELDNLVNQMKEKDANSFEYNLSSYVNGNYNLDLKDNLLKAYELNSSDETVIREMLGYYILTYNSSRQKEFLLKLQKYYTTNELAYYVDALPETKCLLLTSNQEDYYGYLLAQTVSGKGVNVSVVCMDLMKNTSYREMVSNNSGITDLTFLGNEKNYVAKLVESGNVCVALTVPQDYLANVSDRVFMTGLFYQYNVTNQYQLLSVFWEKVKARDIASLSFSGSAEKKLYANYLAPLITLYMFTPDDVVLELAIRSLAKKVDRSEDVAEILEQY